MEIHDKFWEVEENDRQYSPFEFTAKDINDTRDPYESWEKFENGLRVGLKRCISEFRKLEYS
jgi:hypothetical protein